LWGQISEKMTTAGFRHEGRLFTIGLPRKEAYSLARDVIDEMEDDRDFYEKEIHLYLKDFYGFDLEDSVNLMLPPSDSIKLHESRFSGVVATN
jgi:hypothetical protein